MQWEAFFSGTPMYSSITSSRLRSTVYFLKIQAGGGVPNRDRDRALPRRRPASGSDRDFGKDVDATDLGRHPKF